MPSLPSDTFQVLRKKSVYILLVFVCIWAKQRIYILQVLFHQIGSWHELWVLDFYCMCVHARVCVILSFEIKLFFSFEANYPLSEL